MRQLHTTRPHTTAQTQAVRRALLAERQGRRRPSTRLVADAVMAGYIHDISQRHRSRDDSSVQHVVYADHA
jgi:hypothetical protein